MTTYKLEKKVRIFEPELWDTTSIHGVQGAISPSGQLIAIKGYINKWVDPDTNNVFIYDLNGNLKFSFWEPTSSRNGFDFLDEYHLIIAAYNTNLKEILRRYTIGKKEDACDIYEEEEPYGRIELKCISNHGDLVFYEYLSSFVCVRLSWEKKIFEIRESVYDAQCSPNDLYLALNCVIRKSIIRSTQITQLTQAGKILWESDNEQRFLCFSPDNNFFVLSSYTRGQLEIWDTNKWERIIQTENNEQYYGKNFYIGAYSPNGKMLATVVSGSGHYEIYLWDVLNLKVVWQILSPHGTRIQNIKFTFDNKKLITIGEKDIIIWQVQQEQTTIKNQVHISGNVNNATIIAGNDNEFILTKANSRTQSPNRYSTKSRSLPHDLHPAARNAYP